MPSLYLNRLSPDQRDDLKKSLLNGQHGNCFICGKLIDPSLHGDNIDIDHVEPISVGGRDGPENFAVAHDSCNRTKQASDLRVARILAFYQDLVSGIEEENRSPNLGDVLSKRGGSKYDLPVAVDGRCLKISFPQIGENEIVACPVYEDELSGFRYSFLHVPIEYLYHDDHINPRAIGSNLRKLVEEFHKKLPQLHVSLGWIDTSKGNRTPLKIFDGQHKAAAQVLLGARRLPVRVFIDPDTDVLLTANTHAGTTLRQVAFDKSVQRSLGSSLLADRMDRYRRDLGKDDEDESFSERDLVNHFKGESREMKRYVIDRIRDSVTGYADNQLRDYIDYGGRGTERPLSYSTIDKTFYSFFIGGDLLTTPFNHRAEEGLNPRELEIVQIVRLMNIIAKIIFVGKFDHSRGTRRIENDIVKGKDMPEPHLRAFRMAKEEVTYNWLRYIRQIVHFYFINLGNPIDERKLFQYPIPDQCWDNIENFVDALARLSLWTNRDLAGSVFGGKRNYDYWQAIFESGRATDGTSVMPNGINIIEMVQPR